MQGQERILRERFSQLACIACGAHHHSDDMIVLAQRGSRWLLLLTCWQCQRRGIFVATFPRTASSQPVAENSDALPTLYQAPTAPQWLTPSASPLTNSAIEYPPLAARHDDTTITSNDVDNIRRFLEGFNGDFRTLFGPADGLARG